MIKNLLIIKLQDLFNLGNCCGKYFFWQVLSILNSSYSELDLNILIALTTFLQSSQNCSKRYTGNKV